MVFRIWIERSGFRVLPGGKKVMVVEKNVWVLIFQGLHGRDCNMVTMLASIR